MSHSFPPHYDPQHPYSSLLREYDREKLLTDLVTNVWKTALGLVLVPVEDPPEETAGLTTRTAVVHLGGEFQGSVALTASTSMADECAAKMLDAAPGSLSTGEAQDCWGELGNMIAGNLKALVVGPTEISLPTVMEGSTYFFRVPRASPLNEVTYACLGQRVRVTVLRVEPAPAAN